MIQGVELPSIAGSIALLPVFFTTGGGIIYVFIT